MWVLASNVTFEVYNVISIIVENIIVNLAIMH